MDESRVVRLGESEVAKLGGNRDTIGISATQLCESLINNPDKDCIVFPSTLSSAHRKICHEVAGKLGLEHFSVEKEGERRLVICKVMDPSRLFDPEQPRIGIESITCEEMKVAIEWRYEQKAPVHKVTITISSYSVTEPSIDQLSASRHGVSLTNVTGEAKYAKQQITGRCVFPPSGYLTIVLQTDFEYTKCLFTITGLQGNKVYLVSSKAEHDGACSEIGKKYIQTMGDVKGVLKCWGNNSQGAFGFVGSEEIVNYPIPFSSTVSTIPVSAFSAGFAHSAALSESGSIVSWGRLIGIPEGESDPQLIASMPMLVIPMEKPRFCRVTCGETHNLAVTVNGELYAWGMGNVGELGLGSKLFCAHPEKITSFEHESLSSPFFTDVSCSQLVSLAVTKDGSVYEWGLVTHPSQSLVPLSLSHPTYVKSTIGGSICMRISAGAGFRAALLRNKELYMWGMNMSGVLGNGSTLSSSFPLRVDLGGISDVSCGTTHVGVLLENGMIATWGKGKNGQLGHGDYMNSLLPKAVEALTDAIQVSCNGNHTLILKKDGSIWACGEGKNGCLGIGIKGKTANVLKVRCEDRATYVAAGVMHSLAAFA